MTTANGPQMNKWIDDLFHLAKKVEPDLKNYAEYRKGPLLPYLSLLENPAFISCALNRLIMSLGTPAEEHIRKDKLLYLNHCVERVNQTYFFIQFCISAFDLQNIQHLKLLRLLVNELTICLYLYSISFLPTNGLLEKHPEFYLRNINFKRLLDHALQSYNFFLAFMFENESAFPPLMVKSVQEKSLLPQIILRAETCFLRAEKCAFRVAAIQDDAHKMFCNGLLLRILERKSRISNLPESELFTKLEDLKGDDVLNPELTARLNAVYKQRLMLDTLIPQATVRAFTTKETVSDCLALFLQLDNLANTVESYLALPQNNLSSLLQEPSFYDKVFESFHILLKIQEIHQGIDLSHFLFKIKILFSLWNTLLLKLDSPFCLAACQEFEWVKSYCEKAAAFYDSYTLSQKQTSVNDIQKGSSRAILLQKLQSLSLDKTLTLDIVSTTKKILLFAKGIRPNQSKFQVDCFFEEYENIREFPVALDGVLACFLDLLEEEVSGNVFNSDAMTLHDFAHPQKGIDKQLRIVNAIAFFMTYLTKPWDVTHLFHQRFLFILVSALIEGLHACSLLYQAKETSLSQKETLAKILSFYAEYLNLSLLHFRHFTFYLEKYPQQCSPELIAELNQKLGPLCQKALKVQLCMLEISLASHLNPVQALLASEVTHWTLSDISRRQEANQPYQKTSLVLLEASRTQMDAVPKTISAQEIAFYLKLYQSLLQFKNEIASILTEPLSTPHPHLEETRLEYIEKALHNLKSGSFAKEGMLVILLDHFTGVFQTQNLSKAFLAQRYLLKTASLAFSWIKALSQDEEKPFIKEVVILLTHCASFCTETLALQKRLPPLIAALEASVSLSPKEAQVPSPAAAAAEVSSSSDSESTPSTSKDPIANNPKKPKRKKKKGVKEKQTESSPPLSLPTEPAEIPLYLAKVSPKNALEPISPPSPTKPPPASIKLRETPKAEAKSSPRKMSAKEKKPAAPVITKLIFKPAAPAKAAPCPAPLTKEPPKLPETNQVSPKELPEIKMLPKVPLPPIVITFLKKLEARGFRAYVVGGYPRDQLCNVPWWDIDILAQGKRTEILAALETGQPNTFYTDLIELEAEGIHIDMVCTDSIEKSLPLRDLTINTLLINSEGQLVDLLHTFADIDLPYLKLCPDIEKIPHFASNVLRIIRFSTTLNKEILSETQIWLHQHAPKIQDLPLGMYCANIERLFLRGKAVAQWYALKKYDIYPYLFPSTLVRNGMHHDEQIVNFLHYNFEKIDKMSVTERKEQYKVFHVLALLLLPELMEMPISHAIDSQIESVLNAFCKVQANAPYNPEKVRFQKAMHPMMKNTFSLFMEYTLHSPKERAEPLLFSSGQASLAALAADLNALTIHSPANKEKTNGKSCGM